MKRAFTLIELLVVIAIISILAAILFPVFARAKAQAKKVASLANTKQIGLAAQLYLTDSNDLYPLEAGQDTTGKWYFGLRMLVPWNWATTAPNGQGPVTDGRTLASQGFFNNSIQPYAKSFEVFLSPGGLVDTEPLTTYTPNGVVQPQKCTYTYNGLLASYSDTAMISPATVPVIWSGFGAAANYGWMMANPNLQCPNASLPCSYQPCNDPLSTVNGSHASIFGPQASYWEFNTGQNWAYADGHAKFRMVGNTLAPSLSSSAVEPFVNYNAQGVPLGFYWWDGCFPWLFRPDYVPPNGFN